MVKRLIPIILALLLLCACGQTAPAEPDTSAPQPEQAHICENKCEICGLCCNADCADAVCGEKCEGRHQEETQSFRRGDFITDGNISVDTGTLVYDIGENVYVPGHLNEVSEIIAAAMEKVSGLDFDGAGYGKGFFSDGKVHVRISRDSLYAGQEWYMGLDSSEVGSAYASATGHAVLSPGDLFLGNSYAAIHELSHMLMYRQSEWSHATLLNEGFAEYNTYMTLLELEQTYPEAAFYFDHSSKPVANVHLESGEYQQLFSQPMEYWFENTLECSNGNYNIGFRFMAYLHAVYGDYSKWITEFENSYCFADDTSGFNEAAVPRQIEVLKACYGEDVLDNFYPWLKENLNLFEETDCVRDLSTQTQTAVYPCFNAIESTLKIEQLAYNDLYIDLEPAKLYLQEYKNADISGLYLDNPDKITVVCYNDDGSGGEPTDEDNISLADISYISLVGEGELNTLQIKGFAQE